MLGYEWYTQYLATYLQGLYNTYSSFPNAVYVTYYRNLPVTFDQQSMAAYSHPAGEFSPNKYQQILGIPLFMSEPLNLNINVRGETGYELNMPQFTAVMIAPTGIVPYPDDYIVFAAPYQNASTTIYRIIQADPALMFTQNPVTESLQFFKVVCQVDPNTELNLKGKTMSSSFYLPSFKTLISANLSPLFISIYDSLKLTEEQLNIYFLQSPMLLMYETYYLHDLTYLFYQNMTNPTYVTNVGSIPYLGSPNNILYNILGPTSTTVPASSLTQSYVYASTLLPPVLGLDEVLYRSYYLRNVLISTDDPYLQVITFSQLFYPNTDSNLIWETLLSIYNDKLNGTYTLIQNTTNIAQIYNTYVNIMNNSSVAPWTVQSQNIFEQVFMYSLQQKILTMILKTGT